MSEWIKAEEYCVSVFDGTHDTPKVTETGYKLVTSKNILSNTLDLNSAYFISEEDFVNINKRSKVKQYDILFSMIGTVGSLYFETSDTIDYAIKNIGVFSCGDREKAEWLYYYLQSSYARQYIKRYLNGAVQKFLPLKGLREFPVPQFSKELHNRIKILLNIDQKIQINNQINQELEAMAKTLYDYWFVQFDFPDQNGKPYKSSGGKMVYNPELKREIPEGWGVEKLENIANITMGQSPKGTSYNEVGEGMLFFQGSTDFGWRFPVARQYTTEPSRIAEEDDILLSVRAPVGTFNIADTRCCIGRGLAAINSKVGANSYIFNVMQDFKKLFDMMNSVGTTFGSITKDDLYSLKLIYPPNELLMKFDKSVNSFDREIKNRSRQNQELTQLRDWLLPMLMNGQVKVEDKT